MNRRHFLKTTAALPLFSIGCSHPPKTSAKPSAQGILFRRVRPGEPGWPSAASWEKLRRQVDGRLIAVHSPLAACQNNANPDACRELFRKLKNPYYVGDDPALTQTLGWVDAWTSAPSIFAVAAAKTEDVVAAVNFARENNLRLVVKGGGHSYQGTSNAPDSLLIWTRAMNQITLHDAFVGQGCAPDHAPQPAVSIGSGAIWMQAYDAVTTKGGRYVQGGGCNTVGVAGLIQSGGFGTFSKNYGMAAAGLLEAEIVTADGAVRIANPCTNPDLFWGLKGGGGGSLGVVTRVTLRTRELPDYFGGIFATIRARSDAAFRKLIARTISFYHDSLFNPHWGEQIGIHRDNRITISMVFQGLNRQQAAAVWRPFLDSVAASPREFSIDKEPIILDLPARQFWDIDAMKKTIPAAIVSDDRPGAPRHHFFWENDLYQVAQVMHGYKSAWLPASLLRTDQQPRLAEALFTASRHWGVSLHFNKGLAGAPAEEIRAARDTATNPAVLDAFALAIIGESEQPAYPGIPGHEPHVAIARRHARDITKSMDALLRSCAPTLSRSEAPTLSGSDTPTLSRSDAPTLSRSASSPVPGSYVSESDFFERGWQQSFWGSNYPRLAAVKKKYDPNGLFFVHHGVGSEHWSADGFTRLDRPS